MKHFLLTLLLSTHLFSAHTRTIESISYRSNQGATIALIQLTDGSVWKWSPDLYSENLLRRWNEGDQILIQAINHPVTRGAMIPPTERQLEVIPCAEPARSLAMSIFVPKNAG